MAKSGAASQVLKGTSAKSDKTRRTLVRGAIETLKSEGFAGSSARAIAERSGLNQGLIFYHFGSVTNLLLAALDEVSKERMERFSEIVAAASSPEKLTEVATLIFREDLASGNVTVLVEMIAGASSTPGLGVEVAARIEPWFTFARDALDKSLGNSPISSLVPSADVAYAIVALYLGLEMLTHLDGDLEPALRTFSHVQQLVSLLSTFAALLAPTVTQ